MAKTSMKVKQARPAKFSTRAYTRCRICGRPHSVLRKYGVCRICFRELAYAGQIPGVRKASWLPGNSKEVTKWLLLMIPSRICSPESAMA